MRSPAAQILETALALQRAPGERFRLRGRPLPPSVIHLIEVAAGSPQAVQAAASELGEAEPVLVEAARFYLEQVLLADPEADAYRVLGVAADVPHETIRIHQRWLQRWLHPDRALAGDASVFATRVNHAYAQLRTPELRHEYDVRLAEARIAGAMAPLAPETLRHWQHEEDVVPATGRRSRWLLGAAVVSCVVLAVLIVRNPDNAPEWQSDEGSAQVSPDDTSLAPAIEDRDLGILNAALALPETLPQPAQKVQETSTVPEAYDGIQLSAPVPPPAIRLPTISVSSGISRAGPAAALTRPLVSALPQPRASTKASDSPTRPAVASTSSAPPVVSVVPDRDSPSAAAPPQASPPTPPVEDVAATELAAQRKRLAEERVDQLVGYLGAVPGVFPLWNDPGVEDRAARLRDALNARRGSLQVTRTAWQVDADRASVQAAYRCRTSSEGTCEGRFLVDLVWRQGLWLVRGVSLAPPA